jgi:hypothetical protein
VDESSAVFDYRFLPQQWYHVAIVHERGRLLGSSTLSLFVDGACEQLVRLSYPSLEKKGQLAVRGYLGTPPHRAAPSCLSWWLGPTFLFAACVSPAQIAAIAQRGPHYAGTFASNRMSTVDESAVQGASKPGRSASSSSSSSSSLAKSTSSGASAAATAATLEFDSSSIMFSFHAHAFFPLHQLAPLLHSAAPLSSASSQPQPQPHPGSAVGSQRLLSEGLRSVIAFSGATAPGILLPNSSAPPLHSEFLSFLQQSEVQQRRQQQQQQSQSNEQSNRKANAPADMSAEMLAELNEIGWPAGFLSGGAFPLFPVNLSDSIRMIGGMAAVLQLLARASTPLAFRQALVLIGAFLCVIMRVARLVFAFV